MTRVALPDSFLRLPITHRATAARTISSLTVITTCVGSRSTLSSAAAA